MADAEFKPCKLVYQGERYGKGKRHVVFALLGDDGTLGDGLWYDYKVPRAKTVGNIYSGAECLINADGGVRMRGLDTHLLFDSRYPDEEKRLEWEALDREARRVRGLEKADKADRSDMERILLPLRKQYWAAMKRGDVYGANVVEHAVLMALRTPVRKSEE